MLLKDVDEDWPRISEAVSHVRSKRSITPCRLKCYNLKKEDKEQIWHGTKALSCHSFPSKLKSSCQEKELMKDKVARHYHPFFIKPCFIHYKDSLTTCNQNGNRLGGKPISIGTDGCKIRS